MILSLHVPNAKNTPVSRWSSVPGLKDRKDFVFGPGLTIVCGDNGSGKSTLLNVLGRLTHCLRTEVPKVSERSIRETGERRPNDVRLAWDRQPCFYLNTNARNVLDCDDIRLSKLSQGEQSKTRLHELMAAASDDQTVTDIHYLQIRRDYYSSRSYNSNNAVAASELQSKIDMLTPNLGSTTRTVILDDPDRGLDAMSQNKLWGALAHQQKFQVIVATNSPLALDLEEANYVELTPNYVRDSTRLLGI